MPTGWRQCDPRYALLWQTSAQPANRWHGEGQGPANYFADTPSGAWAEFLRHECLTDEADLSGVRRSLWVVELPAVPPGKVGHPRLADAVLFGDDSSHAPCQAEAQRLRAAGTTRLEVRGAALLPGEARGWRSGATLTRETSARDGLVWVQFGSEALVGWVVVSAGSPPAELLGLVRHFQPSIDSQRD